MSQKYHRRTSRSERLSFPSEQKPPKQSKPVEAHVFIRVPCHTQLRYVLRYFWNVDLPE